MRDHRKITIVDDALGFVGGANITADYAGAQLGNGRFRDTHLLISGPATADLALVFARSWQHETHQELHAPEPVTPRAEGAHVQILSSSGIRKRYEIQRALYTAVARAQHRVLITTPYFVPPMRLLRTLRRVAERGVEVFVLTAGVSDVPIATVAARHVYGSLLEAGVRVYEMQGRTLHAKTAVVDGFYAHVGSFNLDRWSYDRNLEVVAMTLDPGVGAALEKVFRDDVKNSEAVSLDAWRARGVIDRLWGAIAWQLCRL